MTNRPFEENFSETICAMKIPMLKMKNTLNVLSDTIYQSFLITLQITMKGLSLNLVFLLNK
jgi:hypothetical protein